MNPIFAISVAISVQTKIFHRLPWINHHFAGDRYVLLGTCTGTNGCMTPTCVNTAMFFHGDPRTLGLVEDHLTIDARTRNFGHCSLILFIQITWEKTALFRADGWQRFKVAVLDPNPQPGRHTLPAVVLLALDRWWLVCWDIHCWHGTPLLVLQNLWWNDSMESFLLQTLSKRLCYISGGFEELNTSFKAQLLLQPSLWV